MTCEFPGSREGSAVVTAGSLGDVAKFGSLLSWFPTKPWKVKAVSFVQPFGHPKLE